MLIAALALCGGKSEGSVNTSVIPPQCPDKRSPDKGLTCPIVQCPDGSTVGIGMECPLVQCPDGTTVGNGVACPPSTGMQLGDRLTAQVGRENPGAADLAEHWHRSVAFDAFINALGLLSGGPSPSDGLAAMISAAASEGGSGPVEHFPEPGAVEVLGTIGGFTVGRWTAGPADHLPITVDWRLAPRVSAAARARVARVAKSWSHRLSDTFDAYVFPAGRTVGSGEEARIWPADTETHGLYLIALPGRSGLLRVIASERTANTYRGRAGAFSAYFWLPDNNLDALGSSIGRTLAYQLGIRGHQAADPSSSLLSQYTDATDGTWTGPNAIAEHGGPVPFWRNWNGTVNYVGLDRSVCPTAASSCHPSVQLPQAIDLAFLADLGYTVSEEALLDTPERYGIGSWGRASAWTLTVERELNGFTHDRLQAFANAIGVAPAQSFAEANRETTGSAVWRGFLIGADLGQLALPPVTGDARITIDLAALTGTAEFSGLRSLVAGRAEPFRMSELSYTVSVDGNRFRNADARLHGAWYGDDHAELAGTLLDTRDDVNLLAAFGGTSMPPLIVQEARSNPEAADLADHWHRSVAADAFIGALGLLSGEDSPPDGLTGLIEATNSSNGSGAVERFPDAGAVDALGAAGGFSVGRWTAGPADHLPITVDWRFEPDASLEVQAQTARVAKYWSHRLAGTFDPHIIPRGQVFHSHSGLDALPYVWPEATELHGPLIFAGAVTPSLREVTDSSYRQRYSFFGVDTSARLGASASRTSSSIGALLGIFGSGREDFPHRQYWDAVNGTWTGPNAVAVYGGPVPFRQNFDGSVGSRYFDPATCPAVMALCPSRSIRPQAIDLAFLADLGYTIADETVLDEPERYGIGSWGRASGWTLTVERDLDDLADDRLQAFADAFGTVPTQPFAEAHREATGTAVWRGFLLGADLGQLALPPVTGSARITIDLAALTGTAEFSRLRNLVAGRAEPFRVPHLSYTLSVNGNRFFDADERLHGAWYGDDHAELAGTLLDMREDVILLAAFGGASTLQPTVHEVRQNPEAADLSEYWHRNVASEAVIGALRLMSGGRSSSDGRGFLADLGYTIADEAAPDELERYGIGSWGRASGWTLTVERDLDDLADDRLQAVADAFGTVPKQPLAEAHLEATGSAVWRGFLLGADLGQLALPPVTGSARITIDFSTLTGTVEFSGLWNLVAGRAEPFRVPHLSYTLSVDGKQFRDADERLHGAWYGDDHAEFAGTLLDTREGVNLLAAFGGSASFLDQTGIVYPSANYDWTHNPTAADLADHWHRTRMVSAVGAALGLSPLSLGDDHSVQDIFDASGVSTSPADADRLRFRAADPTKMVVLGTADGITVGRWTAGPADTLPIQVGWSLFTDQPAPAASLARTARAARNLSRHLRDDFGEHTLAAGTVLGSGLVWPEDTTTNGILVVMLPPVDGASSYAGPRAASLVDGDYQPWAGILHHPPVFHDSISANNPWNYDWVTNHELLHVLGIGTGMHRFPYVDPELGTWNGPNAVAVHGGPVPFRRLSDGGIDFGHFEADACPSLVTAFLACGGPGSTATALDLAVLADIGYELLDPETATDTEIYSLGAWNDEAAWGVLVGRDLAARPTADSRALYDHDRLTASAEAFGVVPASPFAEAHRGLTGEATWRGVLLGVDLADPALAPLTGNATVRVDLATFNASADFDSLTILERGIPHPFRVTDLSYDVLVTGNAFGDLAGKVHGQWYGSGHDTVAGVLDDRDPAINLLGAFGGVR